MDASRVASAMHDTILHRVDRDLMLGAVPDYADAGVRTIRRHDVPIMTNPKGDFMKIGSMGFWGGQPSRGQVLDTIRAHFGRFATVSSSVVGSEFCVAIDIPIAKPGIGSARISVTFTDKWRKFNAPGNIVVATSADDAYLVTIARGLEAALRDFARRT